MKNGVDISSIPRRTTNLIERFQDAMKVFIFIFIFSFNYPLSQWLLYKCQAFDTTASNKNDVSVLQNAYKSRTNDISDADSSSIQPSSSLPSSSLSPINRKSKREVLVSRNVDVDEVTYNGW